MTAISFSNTKIARFAGALYNVALDHNTDIQVLAAINTVGYNSVVNQAFYSDFGTLTSTPAGMTTFSNNMVANMGLTGAPATNVAAYITNQLNLPTSVGNQGAVLSSILDTYASYATDPTYGTIVSAFEAKVANSIAYSNNANSNYQAAFTSLATSSPASTYTLTNGSDNSLAFQSVNLLGGTTFSAPVVNNSNTFQSGDVLTATGPNNTLDAVLGNSANFAIQASTTGIQTAQFEAQAVANDSASTNVAMSNYPVQVDAGKMPDVTTWIDLNSRADLAIESIQLSSASSKTADLTFVMRNTDAGSMGGATVSTHGAVAAVTPSAGVSFSAFLDPQSLRKASSVSTGAVTVEVGQTLSVINGFIAARPFTNFSYTTFAIMDGATAINVPLCGISQGAIQQPVAAAVQTAYDTFTNATTGGTQAQLDALITAAVFAVKPSYVVTVNTAGYGYSSTDFFPRTANSYTISQAGHTLGVPPGSAWFQLLGSPASNAYSATMVTATPVSTTSLIAANVILDHVGQGSMLQDPTYNGATGSPGGDLKIGSMSTSGGVQQLDVQVQNGSWVNSISSTNNTLQVVNIKNSATDSPLYKAMADSQSANQFLAIGASLQLGNDLTGWQTHGLLVSNNGLVDVQTVDATGFTGSLLVGETINDTAIAKYLANSYNLVNFSTTFGNNTTGVTVPAANASYASTVPGTPANSTTVLTASFNSVNETVRDVVAASGNATFTITGSTGNDFVNLTIDSANASLTPATAGNWTTTQNTLTNSADYAGNSVVLNTASTIGNIAINVGGGNNIVAFNGSGTAAISSGTGADTFYIDNSGQKAVWVTNQAATSSNAVNVSNGIFSTNVNSLGNGNVTFRGDQETVSVAFNGYKTTVNIVDSGSHTFTTNDVNNALVTAINGDAVMSKMLNATEASSGASLIINSLVDGVQAAPTITFANTLTAAQIAAGSVFTGGASDTQAVLDAANILLVSGAAVANDGAGVNYTGAVSAAVNNSSVTDAGSAGGTSASNPGITAPNTALVPSQANVIDLASGASLNVLNLYGSGTDVIVNSFYGAGSAFNTALNIGNGSGLLLLGGGVNGANLLNANGPTIENINMGSGTFSGTGSVASTGIAGTTTMNDAAGTISFTLAASGTMPTGATLGNAMLALLVSETAAGQAAGPGQNVLSVYAPAGGANTYVFHTQTNATGALTQSSWIELAGTGGAPLNAALVSGYAQYLAGAGAPAAPAGGGGGGGGAGAIVLAINGAGAGTGLGGATTFNVAAPAAAGTAVYTLSNFVAGDHIVFPAGVLAGTVVGSNVGYNAVSATEVDLNYTTATGVESIHLVGIAGAAGLTSAAQINTAFGAGSVA